MLVGSADGQVESVYSVRRRTTTVEPNSQTRIYTLSIYDNVADSIAFGETNPAISYAMQLDNVNRYYSGRGSR